MTQHLEVTHILDSKGCLEKTTHSSNKDWKNQMTTSSWRMTTAEPSLRQDQPWKCALWVRPINPRYYIVSSKLFRKDEAVKQGQSVKLIQSTNKYLLIVIFSCECSQGQVTRCQNNIGLKRQSFICLQKSLSTGDWYE